MPEDLVLEIENDDQSSVSMSKNDPAEKRFERPQQIEMVDGSNNDQAIQDYQKLMDIRNIDVNNLNLPQELKFGIKQVKKQLKLMNKNRHQSSQSLMRSDLRIKIEHSSDFNENEVKMNNTVGESRLPQNAQHSSLKNIQNANVNNSSSPSIKSLDDSDNKSNGNKSPRQRSKFYRKPVASPVHEERKPLPYSTFAKNQQEGQDRDMEHYIARKQENYDASNNLQKICEEESLSVSASHHLSKADNSFDIAPKDFILGLPPNVDRNRKKSSQSVQNNMQAKDNLLRSNENEAVQEGLRHL